MYCTLHSPSIPRRHGRVHSCLSSPYCLLEHTIETNREAEKMTRPCRSLNAHLKHFPRDGASGVSTLSILELKPWKGPTRQDQPLRRRSAWPYHTSRHQRIRNCYLSKIPHGLGRGVRRMHIFGKAPITSKVLRFTNK